MLHEIIKCMIQTSDKVSIVEDEILGFIPIVHPHLFRTQHKTKYSTTNVGDVLEYS